jgi:glycoside/pentoside/hexuronide:cation symporter, GPH family
MNKNQPPDLGRMPLREKLAYSVGDFGANLYWGTFASYLLFFYTEVFGLTAAAAGTLFLVCRLLDGAIDPAVGMIADRTETRWGKFRPYLLWFTIPFAIFGVLTFTTPGLSTGGKLVWAYSTYGVLMILFTSISIPYSAMLGVISPNPVERTSVASIKFVFAYAGSFVVSGTLLPLVRALGGGNAARGWQLAFIVFGIAYVAINLITFLGTRERVRPSPSHGSSVRGDLRDLFTNPPWVVLALTTVIFLLGVGIRISVTAYYFKYYVGTQTLTLPFTGGSRAYGFIELVSAYGVVGQIAAIVGVLLLNPFAKLVGKKSAFIILLAVSLVSTAAFYFLRPDQLVAIFFWNALGSVSGAPLSALLWAMYADAADFSEWKTGRRATGLVFSASIMGTKIGGAVSAACAGWLLAWIGFQTDVAATPGVRQGLVLLMSLIPAAVVLVSLVLVCFYPLTEARLAEIGTELHARRARQSAAEDAV